MANSQKEEEKQCWRCRHSSGSGMNYWFCNNHNKWIYYTDTCIEYDDV